MGPQKEEMTEIGGASECGRGAAREPSQKRLEKERGEAPIADKTRSSPPLPEGP